MKKEHVVKVVNGFEILVIVINGEKRVPIKPICQALGIDAKAQREKIQADEILGSTGGLSTSVGADSKQREMFTIPYKFAFGWLFGISPKNVAESARENVIRYKLECYNALYEYFEGVQKFLEEKEKQMESSIDRVKVAKRNFNSAKQTKYDEENNLSRLSKITYDEYKNNGFQMTMDMEKGGAKDE